MREYREGAECCFSGGAGPSARESSPRHPPPAANAWYSRPDWFLTRGGGPDQEDCGRFREERQGSAPLPLEIRRGFQSGYIPVGVGRSYASECVDERAEEGHRRADGVHGRYRVDPSPTQQGYGVRCHAGVTSKTSIEPPGAILWPGGSFVFENYYITFSFPQ